MEGTFPNHKILLDYILSANSQPRALPLRLLRSMTDDFSEKRVIGRGGFGIVYKGELENRNIAIKKLTMVSGAAEVFDREISNLMRVKHKNIVRFLGYCNETKSTLVNVSNPGEPERLSFLYTQQRILCFDYISNGSLTDHIHDELRGPEWHTRYKIIKEICQGLLYLHNEKNLVHRDLKPDNILLDDLMVPKIADLGISRLMNDGATSTMTTNANATWEYAAPEFEDLIVSVKYDIYSLGVIIIELVTGSRQPPDLKTVLTRWRHRWKKSNEALRYQQVAKCIQIGLLCKNRTPKKRPSISEIIKDLEDVDGADGAFRQEITYWNELLWVEPAEVFFPFQINRQMSSSLQLHNDGDAYMGFFIKTDSEMHYTMDRNKGVIKPRSHLSVSITLLAQKHQPEKEWNTDEFTIKSKKVNEAIRDEEITKEIFSKKSGDIVEKMRIGVAFYAEKRAPCMVEEETKEHLPLESLEMSGSQEAGETSSKADHNKKANNFPSKQDKKQYTSSGTTATQMEPGHVQLVTIKNMEKAPLFEHDTKVMLELTGGYYTKARPGLDLVAALDISARIWGDRMKELKTAMRFVLQKLGTIDCLSIIIFSDDAKTLCPLRPITEASRLELEELIEGLEASRGRTPNVKDVLLTGLKVLSDRKVSAGRVAAIILLSDNQYREYYATEVSVVNVPVYTFGFGSNGSYKALNAIAGRSMGGTFSHVEDTSGGGLTMAFSQCLAGLLTVAVRDLQLTVTTVRNESMLLNLNAGTYPQSHDGNSVTVSFGYLYNNEVRRVIVNLRLPAVDTSEMADILRVTYSYSSSSSTGWLHYVVPAETLTVWRTGMVVTEEKTPAEFQMEADRQRRRDDMEDTLGALISRGWSTLKNEVMEDKKYYKDNVAQNMQLLRIEALEFLERTFSRAYLFSSRSSHGRQRFAARGDVKKMRLFATPRMDMYLEQAEEFYTNPAMPLPSVDDDVKEEHLSDLTINVASREEELRRLSLG